MEAINESCNKNTIFENEAFKITGIASKNENINIEYFGKLLDNENPKAIFINYGFGCLWDNKGNVKMSFNHTIKKYSTDIEISSDEILYFCFMDENNNWDLDNSNSYSLEIKPNSEIMSKSENSKTELTEIKENKFSRFIKLISEKLISFLNKLGKSFNKSV